MSRDGSVYRDGDRWRAVLDIGAPSGKRRRKKRSVRIDDPTDPGSVERARVEAVTVLEHLRTDYATVTAEVRSVGQLLALWVDEMRQRRIDGEIEDSTYSGYERTVRLHVTPWLGRQALGTFSPADVMAWQRQLARTPVGDGDEPLSVAMRAKALQALKMSLRWGVRLQLVTSNPAEVVDPPRGGGDHGRAASLAEVKKLLAHPSRHRWLYTVLTGLGLRIGEGLGIAWGDVDLEDRILRVGHQVVRERPKPDAELQWVRRLPKGRKPRAVPLPRFVASAFHEQGIAQAAQRAQREAVGLDWRDEWGLVFTGDDGAPLHSTGITRSLARTCVELQIEKLTPHDLRRSCSSLLASEGVQPKLRSVILGHSTTRLTEDVYTRAYDPDLREAMDRLDAAMERP